MFFVVVFLVILAHLLSRTLVIKTGFPYHLNPGGAFSLFGSWHPFSLLSFVVFLLLILYWLYLKNHRQLSAFAEFGFALTIGGAFANLLDRLQFSGVVDFIHIFLLPAFNLADLSLVTGLIIIIVSFLFL